MFSNVAVTSNLNKKLNSIVDESNELASCSVFKQNNQDKRVFYCFSDTSPLPTAKLTHKKRKAKLANYITGSWF